MFLVFPSVSSDKQLSSGRNGAVVSHNTYDYSGWQSLPMQRSTEDLFTAPAAIRVGSFQLRRPAGERFIGDLGDAVYQGLSALPPNRDTLEGYLQGRARAGVTDSHTPAFRDFLLRRAGEAGQHLLLGSTDYLSGYLNDYVTDEAQGLGFVHNIEIDFQTPLGKRRGQGGLSALGALRETERDAIVWQLRGYVAEEDGKGANAGLIYRRAAHLGVDALVGGNVFIDVEKHGESGETFLRWSLGGEYRNAYFDLTANRYFAISDAVVSGGETYYTAEGIDAELNVNLYSRASGALSGVLSGGLGYGNWQGIQGDKDDEGLRYHLRFLPAGNGLHLELQFDVPEEGDEEWGGRLAYRHVIGAAKRGGGGNLGGAERDFDAQGHFFDAARREYAQRIRRLEDGGGNANVQASAVAGIAQLRIPPTAQPLELNAATANSVTVFTRPLTVGIGTNAAAELALAQTNAWTATVGEDSELVLYLENDGSSIFLDSGEMLLTRRSSANNLNRVEMYNGTNTVTIDLYGTQCYFNRDGTARRLVCDEGEVRVTLDNIDDLLLRYGGSTLTIVVDYPPNPAVPSSRETVTLGCASAESRFRHRELDENFPGCFGDARVNMPAAGGNQVIVVAAGETITIERSGTPVSTIIKGRTYTLTVDGMDNIPLDMESVTLTTPSGNAQMVAVHYPTANMSPPLTAALAALAPETATYMLGGGGEVRFVNDSFVVVDGDTSCDADSAPLAGVDNALTACGDISFAVASPYELGGRTGDPKRVTLTVSGGSKEYQFSLRGIGHGKEELRTVAAAAPDEVVLLLNAAAERTDEQYVLRATDAEPRFAGVVTAAELTINVNVADAFKVASLPATAGVFRTRLDDDRALATVVFAGAVGNITYEETYNGGNSEAGLDVSTNEAVAVVTLNAVINSENTVTISLIATDDEDDSKATAVVTVIARHPGAVTAGNLGYASPVTVVDGFYAFPRVHGRQIYTVGAVGNALAGSVSLSGLAAGGSYGFDETYTSPVGSSDSGWNGDQVTPYYSLSLAASGTDLPAVGRHTITITIEDGHSDSAGAVLTLSVRLEDGIELNTDGLAYENGTVTFNAPDGLATLTLTLSGGGGDEYAFALASGNDALGLVSVSGSLAVLTLSSATRATFTRELAITPAGIWADEFPALKLTIAVVAFEFKAPVVNEALTVFANANNPFQANHDQIFEGEFSGVVGNITYDTPTFSSNGSLFIVSASDGSDAVVISRARRTSIPVSDVTISVVATDDADSSKATLVVTVHARDPGAVITDAVECKEPSLPAAGGFQFRYYVRDISRERICWIPNIRNEGGFVLPIYGPFRISGEIPSSASSLQASYDDRNSQVSVDWGVFSPIPVGEYTIEYEIRDTHATSAHATATIKFEIVANP